MKPIVCLAVFAILIGGCTGPSPLNALRVDETIVDAADWTWPEAQVHANGVLVADDPILAQRADFPHFTQMLVPHEGAEPNIGVTKKGSIFVSTFNQVQRSRDFGKTWDVVHTLTSPNYPTTYSFWGTSDPGLWVDPDTDRIFSNHLHPSTTCVYISWNDQDGDPSRWFSRPYSCGSPLYNDHQKLATAPYGPKGVTVPPNARPYPNVLYMCVNKVIGSPIPVAGVIGHNVGSWCGVSFDSGMTFAYDRQITPPAQNCAAIQGHPASYPDGTVVVPYGTGFLKDCLRPVTVVTSEDNGLTWQPHEFPKHRETENDPDITITRNGVAYLLYRHSDQILYLLRSRDKFQTWEGPWRASPPDHVMNAFAVIQSGDPGRISFAYFGTRTPQSEPQPEPSFADGGTIWHLYVSTSINAEDDEPVFVTQQVTPEQDPAQVGCIWFYGGEGGPAGCRNALDFADNIRDAQGRVYVAITDGCTPRNGCAGDPNGAGFQSRDRQVAVAVQDRGWSLFEEKGLVDPIELSPPARFARP